MGCGGSKTAGVIDPAAAGAAPQKTEDGGVSPAATTTTAATEVTPTADRTLQLPPATPRDAGPGLELGLEKVRTASFASLTKDKDEGEVEEVKKPPLFVVKVDKWEDGKPSLSFVATPR
eukprot:Trichotokara_eunicae@DN3132_c0_g1_i2.p1